MLHPLIADNRGRPSRITVPTHAHPLARLVFQLMREHNVTYHVLQDSSGVLAQTLKSYRVEKVPGLRSIEALLGAFGWSLVPVPPLFSLKPETLAAIEEISLDFQSDQQVIGAALAAIVMRRAPADSPAPRLDLRRTNLEAAA